MLGEDAFQAGRDYMEMRQIQQRLPSLDRELAQVTSRANAITGAVIVLAILAAVILFLGWAWYIGLIPLLGCVAAFIFATTLKDKARGLRIEAEALRDRALEFAQAAKETAGETSCTT